MFPANNSTTVVRQVIAEAIFEVYILEVYIFEVYILDQQYFPLILIQIPYSVGDVSKDAL